MKLWYVLTQVPSISGRFAAVVPAESQWEAIIIVRRDKHVPGTRYFEGGEYGGPYVDLGPMSRMLDRGFSTAPEVTRFMLEVGDIVEIPASRSHEQCPSEVWTGRYAFRSYEEGGRTVVIERLEEPCKGGPERHPVERVRKKKLS